LMCQSRQDALQVGRALREEEVTSTGRADT
jgi:hypothetical protein